MFIIFYLITEACGDLQKDIKMFMVTLDKDIHHLEREPRHIESGKYFESQSLHDIKHSPCKSETKTFEVFGYKIQSHECAPKSQQFNEFENVECVTIKRREKLVFPSKKNKVIHRDVGIGCELRFKLNKNHLNKLALS